ncbi:MAG: hypothetical protein OJF51_005074 [Nitrospira sp.]|nr:MAG: hypothetical protein OJF51_005074 [Nitrospira sp.]
MEHVRRFALGNLGQVHDVYAHTCQCNTPSSDDHPPSQRKHVRRLIEVEDGHDTPERQPHSNHHQQIAKSSHLALLKHVRRLNRFDCWTEGLHGFLNCAWQPSTPPLSMASTGESYDDVGKLYSLSSNTQSRKMPLPGRSNRTFVLDVPNDPISDRRVPARQMERLPMTAIRFDDRLPLATFK